MKYIKRIIRECAALLPDELYLRLRYRIEMGRPLNLRNPKTMNEKLQWLKLHNRQPIYTTLVDKLLVKDYISQKIGAQYVPKTLGIWHNADEIDFDALPNRFVLKTNHSGGNTGVVICKDKAQLDIAQARKKLDASLRTDIYKNYREWPYKNVHRLIFAEEYLEDAGADELIDYKFYCFDGYVDAVMLCADRHSGELKFYFFDRDWNLKPYNPRSKDAPQGFTLPKPENLDRMFDIAALLSKGVPCVRVDMYNVSGRIYFGELTFFSASGMDLDIFPETDLYFGSLINLDLCSCNAHP